MLHVLIVFPFAQMQCPRVNCVRSPLSNNTCINYVASIFPLQPCARDHCTSASKNLQAVEVSSNPETIFLWNCGLSIRI